MSADEKQVGNEPQEENPFEGFQSEGYERGESAEEPKKPVPVAESLGVKDDGDAKDDEGGEEERKEDPPKPKQTAQERINELTRLRREAERKAQELEAQLQRLQDEKPQFEQDLKPEPPGETGRETKEKEVKDGPPDPQSFDYGELDPRYIAALVEYQTEQRMTAYEKKMQERYEEAQRVRAHEEARSKFQETVEAGSKKHEDFYEQVVIGAEEGKWALSDGLGQMLVESDVGADIAYHLATHPEESRKVYRQSPLEQARYFGRMEAKFSAGQSAASGEKAVKTDTTKTPKAPPPVPPARGSDGKFQPSANSEDFSAFEKHAMNQER